MTANDFRRIALGITGAAEGAHMQHPDFRANGRIFATLTPDDKSGGVKLTPEQQAVFVGNHPGVFVPAAGAWGLQGYTMIRLASADEEAVGEAITLAAQNNAAQKPASKRRPAFRKRRPGPPSRSRRSSE